MPGMGVAGANTAKAFQGVFVLATMEPKAHVMSSSIAQSSFQTLTNLRLHKSLTRAKAI